MKMFQILVKCLIFLILLILIPLIITFVLTFPKFTGTITIENSKHNKIEIYRDEYSIPHIKSETLDDIFFGIGYAHAQDRLWDMHLKRMLTAGRLSEFGGPNSIQIDLFFRSVDIVDNSKN